MHSVCVNRPDSTGVVPSETLPSGNIWRSNSMNDSDSTAEDENEQGQESVDTTTPTIEPTMTIPVEMTK